MRVKSAHLKIKTEKNDTLGDVLEFLDKNFKDVEVMYEFV